MVHNYNFNSSLSFLFAEAGVNARTDLPTRFRRISLAVGPKLLGHLRNPISFSRLYESIH